MATLSCIFANICIKSVFLHSIKPLKPSNKLFCIIHQNENVGSTKATLFRRVNHFRKYLPSTLTIISSPKEEIVELWDDEKVTPFEYPATIFSDQCTGTAPLSLSKNISMTCLPQWNMFDEKHCISLKYLNVSYYLRKYSTKKDGNRTIVSIESIPEKSHLVRWLYWNGTACINAVSMISSTSNAVGLAKSLGYYMGQIIRIESSNNKTFLIPSGMECDMRKRQVNIRFGIQINTACRLRITTCTQILAQIQYLLDEWNGVTVYSFPYGTNDTVAMQNDRLSSSKMLQKEMDESCELITAASIQFAYTRFGNVKSYSHRLISYKIELSKPDIVDLTTYPYHYIYFNFLVYFVDQTATPIQLFAKIPTINIALPSDFFYPFFTGTLV
ncbi:unnamed protein product [Wuchereria bancrofti]|uniref:Uncharacterized protein n=1 Tax=Wuchereria bancrofti TaxID=6293 RepID=A0A3P7EE98_WUCBA|nr:unnamed protein product [Wuchereria bancrofti]